MSSEKNVAGHDMVHENNPQPPTNLLVQILQEMQMKLDNTEKIMNEMAAQMGQNQEEMQSLPPPRPEIEISKHNKKNPQAPPTQTEK